MPEPIDERRFHELIVESEDLQSDAMKTAKSGLNDYVEAVQENRFENRTRRPMPSHRPSPAPRLGALALGAGVLGVGALALAGPASASASDTDVMALQTAAGLENLAVYTYKVALTLPYIGGGQANKVIAAFAKTTKSQHMDHAQAFNAAVAKLNGKAQTKTDPKYTPVVAAAAKKIKSAGDVVSLAITLEDVAAETYTKNVGQVSTPELRTLFGSVAAVESQHRAILLAVQALLNGGAANLIALPPDLPKLPKAAGSVGFPDAFYPTSMAAPVSEGAVK